jgi:hypothetical protein
MKRRFSLLLVLILGFTLQGNSSFSVAVAPQVAQDKESGYDRSLFKHWIDADKDGCDTRAEVLISEAVIKPKVGKNCKITGGKWISAYDGKSVTDASLLSIDHLVPLAEAWRSGAWAWTAKQRQDYANDLGEKRALMAVTLTSVRTKSDIDINGWRPKLDLCGYVRSWIAIKIRYSLTYSPDEANAIIDYSRLCRISDIPVQALPGYKYQSDQPTPTRTTTPRPTPTVQNDFEARSYISGEQIPDFGDLWAKSTILCEVKSYSDYQALNSYISILDPFGKPLVRKRFSASPPSPSSERERASYFINTKEMIENSGRTYSCLFDVVRLDGSQVIKEIPVKIASIVKSPLPIPQTVIQSMASGTLYEAACFLTNWQDYSLGIPGTGSPISKVTLLRDDGSIVGAAGFTNDNKNWISLLPSNSSKYYLGVFLGKYDNQEFERAAGKRYTCKYEMVGFNGERLVHTEIIQMPALFIPPKPTPTPTPTPIVTPDAFCATAGATGKSANGTSYTCKTSDTDARYRWR